MILPMLILLQTAAPPPPAPDEHRAGVDLPPAWHPTHCPGVEGDNEIVVCGKRDAAEQFRVRPLPEKYAPVGGPGIGLDLGKGKRGNLYAVQGSTIDGKSAPRIMATLTMGF